MNPAWWADEMFDDDDDEDWWRYRRHRYGPYWGGPYGYGWRPPVYVIQQPEAQKPETRPPE